MCNIPKKRMKFRTELTKNNKNVDKNKINMYIINIKAQEDCEIC